MKWTQHIILTSTLIKEALAKLDALAKDAILLVVNEKDELVGSLTDGDVRRGLLRGLSIDSKVTEVIQTKPHFIRRNNVDIQKLIDLREQNFRIIPVLADDNDKIVDVINFRLKRSYLPIDVVIMAGGEGRRLRPLTDNTPKPLLVVGEKPIIEHSIDRLAYYGIENIWISINYLGEQLEEFIENNPKDLNVHFVREDRPIGTIGSVSLIDNFQNDYILVCNSDLLTNVDYEAFFLDFLNHKADLSIVSVPYTVEVPYAVLEVSNGVISDFREKPTYTYYSNGGIYLMKKEMLKYIPKGQEFSATDFMSVLIENGHVVRSYPHHGYWLDIGKHEDFKKAQEDVKRYNFK